MVTDLTPSLVRAAAARASGAGQAAMVLDQLGDSRADKVWDEAHTLWETFNRLWTTALRQSEESI